MTDRDKIFTAIRSALEPLPERTAYPEWDSDLTVSNFARNEISTTDLFRQQLEAAHGVYFDSWDALAAFLREQDASRGYLDEALLPLAADPLKACHLAFGVNRERIDELAFGITMASGGIAESGTVILRDGDSPYRLASLAPWIHIAVLRKEDLHRTVAEAVDAFGTDPSIVFATGPSKTADIEGILIEGVHGPGVQGVLVV
jgi:L-lactate dehydrogenase complex protein LldG